MRCNKISFNNELYTNTSGSVSIVFDNDINTNNTTNETDASNDTNPNGSDGNNNKFDNKRSSIDDSTNLAHRDIQRVLTSLRTQRFNKLYTFRNKRKNKKNAGGK